jgi:alkanesulfonate monooxygenase SsuD/methylene tetrahydromethanopterin reductase-like flavin-dependent oxidoreductase (luciferase family)
VELGVYTFGDVLRNPRTRTATSPQQRLADLLEEVELADQVGLDVFGLGEHHRPDYAVSAPAVVLGAAAARTSNIRLSSAVTVLSSEDPVRVFQQYSTIDLLSGGRAEVMAGRGSFIESFPLFGHDLDDYDELFAEKLDLLLELRQHTRVSWSGRHRAALADQPVYPRPVQDPLPLWVALAIIGGEPERFAPLAELHRRVTAQYGHAPQPVSINSHGFVADTSQAAHESFYATYAEVMDTLGRERGWGPMSREQFAGLAGLRGAVVVGSPEQVAEKILFQHEVFGHRRFLMQSSLGAAPHREVLRSIELLGTEVAPVVRAEVARREAAGAAASA